jgi:mono/diheme cytochrome c family protein
MTIRILSVALLAGLFGTSSALAACEMSFADDVQKLLTKRCVACHSNASPGSGLSLQKGKAHENLVNVPSTELPAMARVTPGDPAQSYLYLKLTDTHVAAGGTGVRMPAGGKLKDEEIALVQGWIAECGAAE